MSIYTPLRYPGGKAKLYNYLNVIIAKYFSNPKIPDYAEPYAGGLGLALKLLLTNKVRNIYVNDLDVTIYSFWLSVINDTDNLLMMIDNAEFSIDFWKDQKRIYSNPNSYSVLEVGFATLYLNRTNRSGIIMGGPIGGMKQNGIYKMDCRFNKEKLKKIIVRIANESHRIHLFNEDGRTFISRIDRDLDDLLIYIDPPYVQKGVALYKNFFTEKDHRLLSETISELRNIWFITYDVNDLIVNLYEGYEIREYTLRYSAGTKRSAKEYVIYSGRMNNAPNIDL